MRDGWKETTLGEVVDIQKGKKPPELDVFVPLSKPYLTADVLRGTTCEQFVANALVGSCVHLSGHETILLWDGAGAGDVFKSQPGILASTMAKVQSKNFSAIVDLYLYLYLDSKRVEIKSSCRGTTVPHVSPEALKSLTFPLPPLVEQKRIVDVVSSVDAYIDALQRQADTARAARNAVLHQLLSTGGDDWTESTLGEIITLEYGKPLKAENRDGKGFPVFGSAGEVGLHSKPLVNEAPVIVVGRKGTAGAVWWSDLPCSVIDTAFYVVQKVETDIRFLYFILGYLDLPSLTAQTGVPGLNRDRAYSSQVLLPPLEEQKRIVEMVSCMDDVIQGTEQAVTDAKNLRSGLLSDLLSGEHEIPMSYDKFVKAA